MSVKSAPVSGEVLSPKVSIIIPAKNEERYLPRTLESIQRQNRDDFEVIVVANACTDRTAEIAEGAGCSVIRREDSGQCSAQNAGARVARGELLLFLDADITLPPQALDVLVRDFGPEDAAATFESRPSTPQWIFRCISVARNAMFLTGLYRSTAGAIVCRTEHFLAVGGFDATREPRANRDLVKKLLTFGRYRCLKAPIIISTRRYERWGLVHLASFWLVTFIRSLFGKPPIGRYEDVR